VFTEKGAHAMQINADTQITYLGHSTFLIKTPGNKNILIDPWLKDNPSCPEKFKTPKQLPKIDIMLITHGHFDHIADAVVVGTYYQPQTLANFEIATWLGQKGLKNTQPMNKGGTLSVPGAEKIRVTLGNAFHSSAIQDGDQWIYAGEPCSFIIQLEDGFKIYFAGDTMIFGDMKWIGELYKPDLAIVPIGDRFTMDPLQAAKACEMIQAKKVIPMHYGTFPLLTGTPEEFARKLQGTGIEMVHLKPGASC
jgi:L-ascorbate metabolism protein UlaG (beta-lactamase superfamily)